MSLRAKVIEQAKSADEVVAAVAKDTGVDGYVVRQALSAVTRFLADALILDQRKLPKRIPGISKKLEARLIASL